MSYDTDLYAWANETAQLLREGRLPESEIENVAGEIEAMGKSQKRELESRLRTILEHMLKLRLAQGALLEQNRSSWALTIARDRTEIKALFEESPSLRRRLNELLPNAYDAAARLVEIAQISNEHPPKTSPFKLKDVLPDE